MFLIVFFCCWMGWRVNWWPLFQTMAILLKENSFENNDEWKHFADTAAAAVAIFWVVIPFQKWFTECYANTLAQMKFSEFFKSQKISEFRGFYPKKDAKLPQSKLRPRTRMSEHIQNEIGLFKRDENFSESGVRDSWKTTKNLMPMVPISLGFSLFSLQMFVHVCVCANNMSL